MAIRILIVDDHAILAEGLRSLLEMQPDMEVIGMAADGNAAIQLAIDRSPDVVLLDHAMPGVNGTEAARRIRDRRPQSRILMLSMYSDSVHVQHALNSGASGYLVKKAVAKEVIAAIRAVHRGDRYLSKQISDDMIDLYLAKTAKGDSPLAALSHRERQVLQMMAEGRATGEIAALLSLSPKTVETYRARLMLKLDVRDLASLVKIAIRYGLASLD